MPPKCKVCHVEVPYTTAGVKRFKKNFNQSMNHVEEIRDYSPKKPKITNKWVCPECGFRLTTKGFKGK